jgi:hypothetical protein
MSVIFGGNFPPITIDWTPTGNYRTYLSADADGFYITLKDRFRNNVWGRITVVEVSHEGEIVDQQEFTSNVTINQQDWRKRLAHAFTPPTPDADACVEQYQFFNNANLQGDRLYQVELQQLLKGTAFQAAALLATELEPEITVNTCSPLDSQCVLEGSATDTALFQGINNDEGKLVAIAAVEINAT